MIRNKNLASEEMEWICTEIKGPIDLTKVDITFFTGGLAMPKFVWRVYCPKHHIDFRRIKKTECDNFIKNHIKTTKCMDIYDVELVEAPFIG